MSEVLMIYKTTWMFWIECLVFAVIIFVCMAGSQSALAAASVGWWLSDVLQSGRLLVDASQAKQ